MSGVAFYVCGTPSNQRGFELVELGPESLPGSPETYLDKVPPEATECHRVESVLVDGERYVQCSRVLRINPNDAEANRGAYVAVGCLIRERLALNAVANCLDVVAEIFGRVSAALTVDRAFPAGFRLADFKLLGASLEERVDYQCSPLLVADVVLQALNGEGPGYSANSKDVVLAPAEMTSTDLARYQLYSREGLLGSLASLDLDRARARQTAERATAAARAFIELQHEWAELEGSAQRLLAKGQALKHLTLDVEGAVKRDLKLAGADDGRAAVQESGPTTDAGAATHERPRYQVPRGLRGSSRGRVGYDAAIRRKGASPQRHGPPRSSWGRLSALVLTGSIMAVLAIFAVQKWRSPESTVAATPPPAVLETEGEPTEQQQPENDVARERAALDAAPNQ